MTAIAALIYALMMAFAKRRATALENAQKQMERLWRATDPYSGESVQKFAREAARLSNATQKSIVSLTVATQRQYFQALGVDVDFSPEVPDAVRTWGEIESSFDSPVEVKSSYGREKRIDNEQVFNRPARQYRYLVSEGKSQQEALAESLKRATMILDANVQAAQRDARHQIYEHVEQENATKGKGKLKGVKIGYRRMIHPELSRTGVCGLCYVAADREYTRDDLLPLHENCHCEVVPILQYSDGTVDDPGLDLSRDQLDDVYAKSGDEGSSTYADDLMTTFWKPDEHGEMRLVMKKDKPLVVRDSMGRKIKLDEIVRAKDDSWKSQFPDPQDIKRALSAVAEDLDKLRNNGYDDKSRTVQWREKLIQKLDSAFVDAA